MEAMSICVPNSNFYYPGDNPRQNNSQSDLILKMYPYYLHCEMKEKGSHEIKNINTIYAVTHSSEYNK